MDRTRTNPPRRSGVRLAMRRAGPSIGLAALICLGGSASLSDTLTLPPPSGTPAAEVPATKADLENLPVQIFLDRLMMAESSGRIDAKNPRSTALGPFQFIEATFLEVARRHFAGEIAGLTDAEILAKRTDPDFARRAALAYTQDNAAFLDDQGHDVTSVNLRLAFLIGPSGATRLLAASADTPVSAILGSEVLTANPFMASMTAADLVRKAALDLSRNGRITGLASGRSRPGIVVRCKRGLASCRRWIALRTRMLARRQQAAQ